MNTRSLWKYVPPAGPVLILTLISLVLLSGLLYYRAIKIQRFMEPALAIAQPRNEFTRAITLVVQKEFRNGPADSVGVRMGSIMLSKARLFTSSGSLKPSAQVIIKKLARTFLLLMSDERVGPNISIILVSAPYQTDGADNLNSGERAIVQRMAGSIQDALFLAEPELGKRYGGYFAAASRPVPLGGGGDELIEIRIIPSELLHIEMLQKLVKYAS